MKTLKFDWNIDYLWGIGSFSSKRVVQRKTEFYFIDTFEEIKIEGDTYVVVLNGNIFFKEDLFNEYYTKLKFPSYFGFNWEALEDCLKDLIWIEQESIIIYHPDLPQLSDEDMKTYLKIIRDSSGEWIGMDWCQKNPVISVFFNLKDYDKVQQFIGFTLT